MTAGQTELTRLLEAWGHGDPEALNQLTPFIYSELRKVAQYHMSREAAGHTLQPTALINEAFLKLIDLQHMDWKSRKHFYAAASQIMRRFLVDYARKKRSVKRGRQLKRVPFEEAIAKPDHFSGAFDIVAFDEALTQLKAIGSRKAQIAEFWFFAGMTIEEIANTLEIGTSTVNRELEFAKVWLARQLGSIAKNE
ncbi:MAG TPA: sigma-70 family RNA polymerase sigma factor [Terriglobia bacterium]|nr:sigma-70 family RNA polymerase sigma factor [Terriglobia bacterium]